MTDIEARARAYAEYMVGGAPGDNDERTAMTRAYLAGARAEVELERKRIITQLECLIEWGNRMVVAEDVKKIIEGQES